MSLKSRAAMLPLGHAGLAIWFDSVGARFEAHALANGTPARAKLDWLERYTTEHPITPRLAPWTPLDDTAQLANVPDDAPGEAGIKGFGPTFPHDPAATKVPVQTVFASPLGDDLLLEVADAAIAGEQLGADAHPDLLVVSLSPHDFVGHGWGHESQEQWDLERRLDAALATFMDHLDAEHRRGPLGDGDHQRPRRDRRCPSHSTAGASRTSRSGSPRTTPPPRRSARATGSRTRTTRTSTSRPSSSGSPRASRSPRSQRVLNALRSFPALEQVGVIADIASHCETRPEADRALCLTFDRERSGDLYYLPARGWIMDSEDEPAATAHGSLHDYDRLVPLIVLPPGRTKHAAVDHPSNEVDMRSVAPLLASWLGVTL